VDLECALTPRFAVHGHHLAIRRYGVVVPLQGTKHDETQSTQGCTLGLNIMPLQGIAASTMIPSSDTHLEMGTTLFSEY
jgi:hypothetical protein